MNFDHSFVFQTYKDFKNRNTIVSYQGPLLYSVIAEISHYIRGNISDIMPVREKVFYIFIELAQNIRNHSAERTLLQENGKSTGIGTVFLTEEEDKFILAMGNLVNLSQFAHLKQRCDEIIQADRRSLRDLKSRFRTEALEQNHQSGNIGLVDVALKSGNPLEIQWIDVDQAHCYFLISVSVSKVNVNVMEDLIIEGEKGTYLSPDVYFSAERGVCEIKGESYQEETFEFYNKLTSWLGEYIEKVKKPITFDFKLTYFNTSSSRAILDMLNLLKQYQEEGGEVTINWYYLTSDENMIEEAEDFQSDSALKFNLIPVDEEQMP